MYYEGDEGMKRLLTRRNILLAILGVVIIIAISMYIRDKNYYNYLWQGITVSENGSLSVKNEKYYNKKGTELYDAKKYDEAIKYFDKAIKVNPKYANAYYNRGNSYRNQGQRNLAIADYTKAIALNPRDIDYYLKRGDAYEWSGQLRLAVDDYNRALKINPNDIMAFGAKYNVIKGNGSYNCSSGYIYDTTYNPFTW